MRAQREKKKEKERLKSYESCCKEREECMFPCFSHCFSFSLSLSWFSLLLPFTGWLILFLSIPDWADASYTRREVHCDYLVDWRHSTAHALRHTEGWRDEKKKKMKKKKYKGKWVKVSINEVRKWKRNTAVRWKDARCHLIHKEWRQVIKRRSREARERERKQKRELQRPRRRRGKSELQGLLLERLLLYWLKWKKEREREGQKRERRKMFYWRVHFAWVTFRSTLVATKGQVK